MKKFSLITRENSRRSSLSKKIGTALLCAGVFVVLIFFTPRLLAMLGSFIFVPVHSLQTWLTESKDTFPLYIRDRSALIGEIDMLKYEASAQSGDALTVELLRAENESLRTLLGAQEDPRLLAGVIGRPPFLPYDVIVIDKGASDGILEGAPVFVGADAVIGVVDTVFQNTSIVVLATTNGFKSSVFIVGPNIYTTAVGIGGGVMRIGVPQGIELAVGNPVVLPGVNSGVYGKVDHVHSVAAEAEQEAFVSPAISLSSLRYVSVGRARVSPVTFEEANKRVENISASLLAPIPDGVLVTSTSSQASTTSTSTP